MILSKEEGKELGYRIPTLLNNKNSQRIYIKTRLFTIGRKPIAKDIANVDFSIDDKCVSRNHAEIEYKNDKFYIIDNDSLNGTYINGIKLISNTPYELKHRDCIKFANTEFEFHLI